MGTYGGANLHKVLANGLAVVHSVKSGNFVNAHGGHLQHASDFIHDADASETVLALTQVQQRHHGGLLVLGRVALQNLIDDFEVLLRELERKGRVVLGLVAVLCRSEKMVSFAPP